MAAAGGAGSKLPSDSWGVHFGLYALVVGLLLTAAAAVSFMWFFAATMASDGCHGNDADYICSAEGQHWAIALPVIAFVASSVTALIPIGWVTAFSRRPAWVWIGVPFTIGTYVAAPYIANWGRLHGIW
ncbi:hypothetical protein [Mycobacterium sp. NPDC050853]|uniref:hypothetical protein n=1 Tax=Mycobacteriaceae TaxID=1762 RepID=UPI0015DEA33E|nr:hypothetical protein [Mycobacteroides sp. LB1]